MEVVTGATGNIPNKLDKLLKEYKLKKGIRQQVQSLSREVESIYNALRKVAEVPQDQLDEQIKLWARDIKDVSYDIEEIIDTFLVRVGDGREATLNPNRLERLIEKMCNLFRKGKARHKIADAIKDINNKLQEVAKRHGRCTIDSTVVEPDATSTIDPRIGAMYRDAAQLVGIDGPRDTLIKMLFDGDDVFEEKMKIVSVVGFEGLGKTTLAKVVYDELKTNFECRAFVSVGQNPDMKKVFKDIIIDLDEQKYINLYMTMWDEKQLIDELHEFLENKRYFIIIDDIWDKKSWEIIRCALPDNNLGSRVVATTRISEVATNVGNVYKLQPLSRDNSEKLFNTRIVDCEGKYPHNQSTEVYDAILNKCGGVPLAIITIASLLASKPREDWSEVYNSIGFGHEDNDDVDNVVAKPAMMSTIDPRLLALYKDAAQLVGIDGPRDGLIKMLFDGDNVSKEKMKIVSVVGFGGLGKTTLAKVVYDELKAYFDCRAFVSVGQNPDMNKVFKDIIIGLDKQKYTYLNMTMWDEMQLIRELRQFLTHKRYFIIIDDIWDKKLWKIIRCALPDSNLGSRVVATTRIFDVATNVGDVYKLQPLSLDNSKKLFNTRIVDCEGKRPHNQSTEVYDKILKKCGGVPLAIITIASLLASKPEKAWSEVYNSIGYGHGHNDDVENTRKILSFSYYDLPSQLRSCLLYLSIFPEDYVIDKYLLIWKWIAEGFIHDEQGIGLLEVGERYFNELVNRSMIKPDELPDTGYVRGCRVHDMVLDLVRSFSSDENFVTILDNEQQTFSQNNARRLAVQNRKKKHNPLANMGMQHVMSFTAIWCSVGMISPSFRVLRVLAIEHCGSMEGYNSLKHLGNLVHLRYLGLSYTPIRELPKEIGDLKFLQTLDLTETGIEELPPSVGLLTQLMCLRADKKTRAPDWIGNLTSLQDLSIHPAADRSAGFVNELGNLRELRVLMTTIDVWDEDVERALVESLCNLHKIQFADIGGEPLGKGVTWEAGPVSPRLHYLYMGCLEFSRLPTWINSSLLPNICFLYVNVQVVQEQDMETLGRLPQLHSLQLVSRYTPVVSIVGEDGRLFHKLRFFMMASMSIRFVHGMTPIMPSLEALHFDVHVRFMKDANLGFDKLGLGSLPSIQKVTARIICLYARAVEVEEAEAALRHAAAVHPNRPTLQTIRPDEDLMLSSDQEQEPSILNDKVVHCDVDVRKQKDEEHYFNFCWLLLNPCVEKVRVCINCEDARVGEVEEAEATLRHAVDVHPNHLTLEITRQAEDKMMLSDQH